MRQVRRLLLAGFIIWASLWASAARVQAVDGSAEAAATPLTTAPKGLNQLSQLFTLPATFTNGVKNSASIQKVTNAAAPNTEAIEINSAKKQLGGAWSSDANRFDINQDATLKMWVYLGTSTSKAGDGLAFVMQNDANGTGAASSYTKQTIIGETMGVWGVDDDKQRTDAAEIAATGIQNSWALEFDTYSNTSKSYSDAGSGTAFDVGIKGQHIAAGYPGSADQYTATKVTQLLWADRYLFTQNHIDAKPSLSLTDGAWHHLVLKWDASAKTMTYTFNDINPDGSDNATAITQTEAVDTTQFNSSDGLVRWGFVGTNGSNAGNSLVVFESLPNLLDATAAVKVTDNTKDKVVTAGSKVKAKDQVTYEYTLDYQAGAVDWDAIKADLKLPTGITFDTAEIKYANGEVQTVAAPAAGDSSVTYDLAQALSTSNPTAVITLKGQADDVKINTATTATAATFTSDKFETTTTAPDYTVTVDQDIQLYIPKQSYTIDKGSDLKITGLVFAEDSEQIKNSWITVNSSLNGEKLAPFKMSDDDESGVFSMVLKADQLHVGDNELKVHVVDEDENESNEVTIAIKVSSGALGFKTIAATSKFAAITVNGKAQTATRENDWQLVVSDERGKGSSWQLQASAGDFTNEDGQVLPSQIVYKNGDQATVINGAGTIIDQHESTSDSDEYDVMQNWTADTGLLIETNAAATPGSYSGKITWTLSNAPS
ncbi:cell surface protein [Lactobacillus sp. CBA3606]|uniref:lectin-like domain-containing protein n=1 Tax=Lactobacillus sp. CBA3606 TaxID=2099789 RepID=UPI000CFC8954|nr:cell surface protein [Lactobacillus sp. CBA3606]AVK63991.1 cell surface protein [Lactobacillus sp. CBA3606]